MFAGFNSARETVGKTFTCWIHHIGVLEDDLVREGNLNLINDMHNEVKQQTSWRESYCFFDWSSWCLLKVIKNSSSSAVFISK